MSRSSLPWLVLALSCQAPCSPDEGDEGAERRSAGTRAPAAPSAPHAAQASDEEARAGRSASGVVDLRRLHASNAWREPETVETTVDDPVYERRKRYRGVRLMSVLGAARMPGVDSDEGDAGDYEVRFTGLDGYEAQVALDRVAELDPVLAVEDLEAPGTARWMPFAQGKGHATPGPYYLVWPRRPDPSSREKLPWPYQIAVVEVRSRSDWEARVDRRMAPPEAARAAKGYRLFRTHCMSCHSMNLVGGKVGPELNVPKNVTEYWARPDLRSYIAAPDGFRAGARMPAFEGLGPARISALVRYLDAMRAAKVCETEAACRNMLAQARRSR
jgi:mono/diheme cytochrome c family protein